MSTNETLPISQSVLEAMGAVQLQFIEVSADRYYLRYARQDGPMLAAKPKWRQPWLLQQMGAYTRTHFAVLTCTKRSPSSKSGFSYDILGILFVAHGLEELRQVNVVYWEAIKGIDLGHEKLAATVVYADLIHEWLTDNGCEADWCPATYELLLRCAEGRLKEVKQAVKKL